MSDQQELVLTKGTSFAPAFAQNVCWLIPNHWMWANEPLNKDHLLIRWRGLNDYNNLENPSTRTYLLDDSFVQNVKFSFDEMKRYLRAAVDFKLARGVVDRSRVPVEVCIALGMPPCPFSLEPHVLSPVAGEGTLKEIEKKVLDAQWDLKRLYSWILTAILRRLSGRKGLLYQPSTVPLNSMKGQLKGLIRESRDFHWGLGYREIDEIAGEDKKRRHNGNGHAPAISALTNSCDHEGGSSSANSSTSTDSKGKKKARLSPPPPIVTLGPGTVVTKTQDPRLLAQRARALDFFVPTTNQAPLQVIEGNVEIDRAPTVTWKNDTKQLAKYFPNVVAKSPSPIPRLDSPPPPSLNAPFSSVRRS